MSIRLLLVLMGMLAVPMASAGIYKWVDEQGVTHYSATPPVSGAEEIDLPRAPTQKAVEESRARAKRLLETQKRRRAARKTESEVTKKRETLQRRRLFGKRVNCNSAKRHLTLFQKPRPIYRLNSVCERVYVSVADRHKTIELLKKLIPNTCTEYDDPAIRRQIKSLLDQIIQLDKRYLGMRGEPITYPNFESDTSLSSPDFCRCAPRFLQEMEKPQYSDPSYFGHKKKPKKRPPGKKKFCKECGMYH